MKILICGGRNYSNMERLCAALLEIPLATMIIQGGASGADALARGYAEVNGIHYAEVPALWDVLGKKAGPLRNAAMLTLKPDYCLALPGGKGTDSMCALAEAAGVPTWRPYG